jgi:hypothetical protein
MAWHLFVTGPWQLGERPDQLLEQVFAFFDAHPDLPYIVLLSDDSSATRHASRDPSTPPLIKNGYYIPDMPDSTAVFVLARRERVEPLRPYVWDDLDNDYLQENLRMMYYALKDSVPTPEKLANPEKFHIGRNPTVAEWLTAAAAFAKRPVFEKEKAEISLAAFLPLAERAAKGLEADALVSAPMEPQSNGSLRQLAFAGFHSSSGLRQVRGRARSAGQASRRTPEDT